MHIRRFPSLWTVFALGLLASQLFAAKPGFPSMTWVDEPADNPKLEKIRSWMQEADQAMQEGSYKKAYKRCEKIAKHARMPENKAKAMVGAGDARFAEGQGYEAYEAYQQAADNYANMIPLNHVVKQEYEIAVERLRPDQGGFLFFPGSHNEMALEVYDHVAEAAPYSVYAPLALYRGAIVARWEKQYQGSIDRFHKVINEYHDSRLASHAQVEVAITLLEAAEHSDGDGTQVSQARRELNRFLKLYPEHPRRAEAEKVLARANEVEAQRLLYLAKFYRQEAHARPDEAKRYLETLIEDYGDTPSADKARRMLGLEVPPRPTSEEAGDEDTEGGDGWWLIPNLFGED